MDLDNISTVLLCDLPKPAFWERKKVLFPNGFCGLIEDIVMLLFVLLNKQHNITTKRVRAERAWTENLVDG